MLTRRFTSRMVATNRNTRMKMIERGRKWMRSLFDGSIMGGTQMSVKPYSPTIVRNAWTMLSGR